MTSETQLHISLSLVHCLPFQLSIHSRASLARSLASAAASSAGRKQACDTQALMANSMLVRDIFRNMSDPNLYQQDVGLCQLIYLLSHCGSCRNAFAKHLAGGHARFPFVTRQLTANTHLTSLTAHMQMPFMVASAAENQTISSQQVAEGAIAMHTSRLRRLAFRCRGPIG
jgi:hypothetical protein